MADLVVFVVDSPARLDAAVAASVEDVTRSLAQKLIGMGNVSVNGMVVTKNGYALSAKDAVAVQTVDPVELSVAPEDIPIDIVYEDADMIVVNKQQGLVVHPSVGTPSGTLVNALMNVRDRFSGINGVVRPGIVHRLDKNTSGLLVVAKNDKAHLSLAEQIATKEAKRFYMALVDGNIKEDEGVICEPIARNPKDRKQMAVVEGGREATTLYTVVERFGQYTLVKFELKTGRTHQIRVHAKYLGHPVVGDKTYGSKNCKFNLEGQLLHAFRLELDHPDTGERMIFEAPLPEYFTKVLNSLGEEI